MKADLSPPTSTISRSLVRSFVLLFCVLAVAGFALSCGKGGDLSFSILFKDAKDLKPGQFVVYKGIQIGEVSSVDLDSTGGVKVQVKIDPKYRDLVYREASFIIEKRGGLLDISGEKQVTMEDSSGAHTPIKEGDVIQGQESLLDRLETGAKELGKSLLENGGKATSDLMGLLKELKSSPQAQALLDSLEQYSGKMASKAGEGLRQLSQQKLQTLKEKAQEMKKSLEASGKTDQAKQFWQQFLNWLSTARTPSPPRQAKP